MSDTSPAPKVRESAKVALRRMVPADLETVMVLERAAFKHPWSTELFARELEHDWSTVLVAEETLPQGLRIVGFVIFWLVHDEIHVLNVATDPAERGRGIARALLDECFAQGKAKGAHLATLEVRRSNESALRLYDRYGFRRVGVRPNYYADEGEDAIVMLMEF
ncbi:MAG TPA: ribosomal protein S18-alanine N-acetyltransferase [Myxococcales bacterium]|jgi:ribosomal-protein-alanine N-acetyltransferase